MHTGRYFVSLNLISVANVEELERVWKWDFVQGLYFSGLQENYRVLFRLSEESAPASQPET